jgi:hypothetical protein
MAKKHKKPTGTVGCISISADGRPPQFQQVHFPPEKAAIERKVVAAAVFAKNDLGRFYQLESDPVQNDENDLDFTLNTLRGEERLELMEIAFLKTGSYDTAPLSYNYGELADAICAGIAKKSRLYGDRPCGIHLLLYSTDFRFSVCNDVLWLVSKWCSTTPHAFDSVVYVMFLGPQSVEGKIVHPQPDREYSIEVEKSVRGRRTILGDMTRMEATTDRRGVEVPLGRSR